MHTLLYIIGSNGFGGGIKRLLTYPLTTGARVTEMWVTNVSPGYTEDRKARVRSQANFLDMTPFLRAGRWRSPSDIPVSSNFASLLINPPRCATPALDGSSLAYNRLLNYTSVTIRAEHRGLFS